MICFLTILVMLAANPLGYSQMPVTAPGVSPAIGNQIGVVAAARGSVELKLPGQVGRVAQSGQPVFLGDEVKTDAQGNLQILLLDETVFTIGPNSALVIDEFVYDPKTQDGKVKANIAQGVFRYVSGKIAAKKPSNVSLKLPTATIGIRGTIVGGNILPGGNSLVALLGPGLRNNAGAQPGSFFILNNGQNGGGQEVNRTGYGVLIDSTGHLSGIFQLSAQDILNFTTGLNPSGGGNDSGSNGSATDTSGQGNVNTGENSGISSYLSNLNNLLNDDVKPEVITNENGSDAIADGITRLTELSRITTGTYHYSGSGAFVQTMRSDITSTAYLGTVMTSINIDFGSRTIGGGNSYVDIDTTSGGGNIQTGQVSLDAVSFDSGASPYAIFTPSVGSEVTATVTLMNANGTIAQNAITTVYYDDHATTSRNQGSGSTTGSRSDGPTSGQGLN